MKSCEFKTSEASTKSWFRTNGLIDKFLNILDLNKFRIKNTEFSDYAKTQYGVEGRLFYEERGGKKALPNTTMFHQIDAAKGNWYKENEYLKGKSPYESYINDKGKVTGIRFDIQRDTTRLLKNAISNVQRSNRILWKKQNTGTSRGDVGWENSWLFNDPFLKQNEQFSAKEIWEKYQATGDERYTTTLAYFFADRLLEKGGDFVGKLFRRGDIILSSENAPFAGNSNELRITPTTIKNILTITGSYEDFEKGIELVLTEEAIHHTIDKLITNEEIETIYNELTQQEIDTISNIYKKPNLSKHTIVHEYLRMILQKKHFGVTSESELYRSIFDVVHRLIKYLKELFQNNPTSNIVVNRFEEFLKASPMGAFEELNLIGVLMKQNNTTSIPIADGFEQDKGESSTECFI